MTTLEDNEFGLSEKSLPGLYQKRINSEEMVYIKYILDQLLNKKDDINEWPKEALNNLYEFFVLLNDIQDGNIENSLHLFLYLFWNQIEFEDNRDKIRGEIVYLGSGKVIFTEDLNKEKIKYSEKIINSGVKVDLVNFDIENQTLYLIEIKNKQIDDRTVGQILRYYNLITERLLYVNRSININYIKPIIIMFPEYPIPWKDQWLSLPVGFRELVEVFFYENQKLKNKRRSILSLFANDHHSARRIN